MRMSHHLLLLLVLVCTAFTRLGAQESKVRFKIAGPKNEPVPFATVVVVSLADSSQQKKVSDSSGVSKFQLIQNHSYIVRISSVNYNALEKNITVKGGD